MRTRPDDELIVNEDIVRTKRGRDKSLVVTFTRSKMDTGETSADVDQGGDVRMGTSSRRRRSSWRRWFSDRESFAERVYDSDDREDCRRRRGFG